MEFHRSNKFDFCYYGQVNSLLYTTEIKCSFEMGKHVALIPSLHKKKNLLVCATALEASLKLIGGTKDFKLYYSSMLT